MEAARFLQQATFGATKADIDRVMSIGYSAWIDEQISLPATRHRAYWSSSNAVAKAGVREVIDSFYIGAVVSKDQLRQRMIWSLSQIFVISTLPDAVAASSEGVAGYMDMLGDRAFGSYRHLLEGVATHPMMGVYLSSLRNMKEDPATGRSPDQNFAREILQLFSIGTHQLNSDGSPKLSASGAPAETYGPNDIVGLSRVFTGFSWAGPDASSNRFYGGSPDPSRLWAPMQPYNQFHSVMEKSFLGSSIAEGSNNAAGDLKTALDRISTHPNVAPFIAKQLIQRMVTSNPSRPYVARAAAAFAGGDLRALVKAILLDPEARSSAYASGQTFGKVKDPVLRLTQTLRALQAKSDSGKWLVSVTDGPAQLSQTPMRSPSVFNFYRPGYVAPNSVSASFGMVAPELQIWNESTSSGYAHFMMVGFTDGFGQQGPNYTAARRDVQINWSAYFALANDPAALVARVDALLFPDGPMTPALKALIIDSVASVNVPARTANNAASVEWYQKMRVYTAFYLAVISPQFLVQK